MDRYHRTPCLSKKQKAALEEQIRKHPEQRDKLRRKDPRETYKVFDEDGNVIIEFDPETDATWDVTIDEKRRFVKAMHAMDDSEVKRNCKERRLDPVTQKCVDEMVEKYRNEFFEKYGYYPEKDEIPYEAHRSFHYLDAPIDADGENPNEDGDHSKVAAALAVYPFDEEDDPVACLDAFIQGKEFTDKERTVYDCKFHKRMTDEETGKIIGSSGQYAGRLWKGIREKIVNNSDLKKFYRF